jgi:hypothetical protein
MTKEPKPEGILVDAAKAIGRTAGKVAALVGASEPAPRRVAAVHKGKLVKKNKQKLPRREKKAQSRAAAKLPLTAV